MPGDGFETLAIHAGQEPDPVTGAVVPPIYQVSTYAQDGVGKPRGGRRWIGGYEYSRTANPTRGALEECLAALEGGSRALAFASGMAAEDCVLRTLCRPGDRVLIPRDAYGGTFRLFDKVASAWGLDYLPVDMSDAGSVLNEIANAPVRLVWAETPTNPLLSIADIVVHSTTKYLGGHSDVVGGAVVVSDPALAENLAFLQNATGGVAGPFDAWLTLRGIKTLGVRMDRHCASAARVAEMLAGHPAVAQVFYPGLASHPGHEIAAKQMRA